MLFFGKYCVILRSQNNVSMEYTYKYPHPAVTADNVVFGYNGSGLSILLIKRGIEPFKGEWAFPGGFFNVEMDQSIEECARRELKEETNVDGLYCEQLQMFSRKGRDPRELTTGERVLTVAFLAFVRQDDYEVIGGDDAVKAEWFPLNDRPRLAFDHEEILQKALERLRWKVIYEGLAFRLLNKTFTMAQVKEIYEAVLDRTFDRGNFIKKMTSLGYVVPLKEKVSAGGRPATLYQFDEETYRQVISRMRVF